MNCPSPSKKTHSGARPVILNITEMVYKADTAQMRHDQRAANKGRGLKKGSPQLPIGSINITGRKWWAMKLVIYKYGK
jgi:hypothetical protein